MRGDVVCRNAARQHLHRVPGRVVEAEELWYDPNRWAAWIDGFGHVDKLEGEWPQVGARLLWDSRPQGRGRVPERVAAYEPRSGQTLDVEDSRLFGTQSVAFEPEGDQVRVSLTLEYRLKTANPHRRSAVHPARAARLVAADRRPLRPRASRRGHQILTRARAASGRLRRHATTFLTAVVAAARARRHGRRDASRELEARAMLPGRRHVGRAVPAAPTPTRRPPRARPARRRLLGAARRRRRQVLGDARQRIRHQGQLALVPAAPLQGAAELRDQARRGRAASRTSKAISFHDPDHKVPFPIVNE